MKAIALTQGQVAIIDDADFPRLAAHRWYGLRQKRRWVAVRKGTCVNGSQPLVYMHREIMGAEGRSSHVDHIDHDSLNNRRANLRLCTPAQNQYNQRKSCGKSRFKGVHRVTWPGGGAWLANIRVNRRLLRLGHHATEAKAAHAYDAAARQHFGAFAALNFPVSGEGAAI